MNVILRKFYEMIGLKKSNKLKRIIANLDFNTAKLLKKNVKYKDLHKGERCFIIGSGPSVKKIDFKKLEDEITFTVNQFSRFESFSDLKTNYHVFSDERIFRLNEDIPSDLEALKYLEKLIKSSDEIKFFSKISSKSCIENSKYLKDMNVNYYMDGLTFHDDYNLDIDMTKQIPWFPTVIDYCIFIAIYMGFEEIYLLGCDCTGFLRVCSLEQNIIKKEKKYYYGYEVGDSESKRIENQLLNDGIGDELEIWSKIFRYYDYIQKMVKKQNIKIVNCTGEGLLNSFECKSLDEVLNNYKKKGDKK